MASENETVADIVAAMMNESHAGDESCLEWVGAKMRTYADRFEAAHRREVAELKSKMNDVVCENEALRDACGTCGAKREREATREKASQVGNAAKMREALEEISRKIWKSIDPFCNDDCCKPKRELAKIADAALSAPPRNCDVGTVAEQNERFDKYCYDHRSHEICCDKCPIFGEPCCELAWSQLPYEEGGAK